MRGLDGVLPEGVLVIGIETALAMRRETVREHVREIAKQILASVLSCAPGAVKLDAQPGQRLRLAAPDHALSLSLSHAPGLSLLAISLDAQVGIDLMLLEPGFGWAKEHAQVARDYLGPASFRHIDALPPEQQQHGFAKAWTAFEAGLKLHGRPMQEWDVTLQEQVTQTRLIVLDLPAGMVGSLASFSKQTSNMPGPRF